MPFSQISLSDLIFLFQSPETLRVEYNMESLDKVNYIPLRVNGKAFSMNFFEGKNLSMGSPNLRV